MTDRIARLRIAAWPSSTGKTQLSGVRALVDFATTAALIHTSAAKQLLAGSDHFGGQDGPYEELRRTLLVRSAIWRRARSTLLAMTSYFELDATFTEDIRAVSELLTGPLAITAHRPMDLLPIGELFTTNPADPRHLVSPLKVAEELVSTARTFEQISAWNAITLTKLATNGDLYLPAGLVSQDELGRQPDLLIDRARWEPVRAPGSRVKNVLAMYEAIRTEAALNSLGAPLTLTSCEPFSL